MAKDEQTVQPEVTVSPPTVPYKKHKLLDEMRANPAADWTIADVATVCRRAGLVMQPPGGGSHYKVYSPNMEDGTILTVVARKPIKSFYIKALVELADEHMKKGGQL